jgi:hypothetical protein
MMRRARGGDRSLLHRFEQRRLRLRRRAIDFIREQKLREERAAAELENVAPVRSGVHDVRAHDVRGHEVGRELDSPKSRSSARASVLTSSVFPKTRHTFEQHVAARDNCREHALDDALLATMILPTASRSR